ncbi:MAG: prolyl oligopeptidase family serine peptidase [Longimicrobiales bacterium]
MRRVVLLVAALALLPHSVVAQRAETGFLDRSLEDDGTLRHYQVFVPRSYDAAREWPVVLFLHGGGAQGTDGYRPTHSGIGAAIRLAPERFPAIVVFPQVRPEHQWTGDEAEFALRTLDAAEREFNTDPDRVYLTGLSRGGRGSYYISYRHPSRFAAILAASGRVGPAGPNRVSGALWLENSPVVPDLEGDVFSALAERLQDMPMWVFHGDEDEVIPVEDSRRLVSELQVRGAPALYSELAGVGHNAWDAAYQSAEVIEWLFNQRRSGG